MFSKHSDRRWQLLRLMGSSADVDFTDPANDAAAQALPWVGIPERRPAGAETQYVALAVVGYSAGGAVLARGSMTFDLYALERVDRGGIIDQDALPRHFLDSVAISTGVTLNRKILLTIRGIDSFCVAIRNIANAPGGLSAMRVFYRIE